MDQYYSFVYRGILAQESLNRTGHKNKTYQNGNMDQRLIERLPFELLDPEQVSSARDMATIFMIITAFENSVRDFVHKRLVDSYHEDWWVKGVSDNLRRKAETRRTEEEKVRFHVQRGDSLMMYLDFGDLPKIIDQNWKLFEPHVPTQDWVRALFSSLELSRNVLMHSGQIDGPDIERVGSLIRDWVRQVGA